VLTVILVALACPCIVLGVELFTPNMLIGPDAFHYCSAVNVSKKTLQIIIEQRDRDSTLAALESMVDPGDAFSTTDKNTFPIGVINRHCKFIVDGNKSDVPAGAQITPAGAQITPGGTFVPAE
jgi:hypothetical protein